MCDKNPHKLKRITIQFREGSSSNNPLEILRQIRDLFSHPDKPDVYLKKINAELLSDPPDKSNQFSFLYEQIIIVENDSNEEIIFARGKRKENIQDEIAKLEYSKPVSKTSFVTFLDYLSEKILEQIRELD